MQTETRLSRSPGSSTSGAGPGPTGLRPGRVLLLAGFLAGALAAAAAPASAQYFGRNKVQYKDFDFAVVETEHFDVYHYETEHEAALQAGRMAERWYARLSRILDHELRGRQPLILYASHPDFEQTNAIPGQIGEATGGVTEALKRRIVLPLAGSLAETDHVLGHELVHAFQYDITGGGPGPVSGVPVAARMPLWFIEGMAEYLSLGGTDPFKAMWLRGALKADALPELGDLRNQRKYFPYYYGHIFWAYVGGRWGDQSVGRILKAAARARSLGPAFTRVLGIRPDSLVADWHAAIRDQYGPVLEATGEPGEYSRELISEETGGGRVNMGPALSPDGEEMIFVTEKGQFSVELYLADAETGEIKRRLTSAALDPHFQSLQYLHSAGAWSPDGERFALAAVSHGEALLTIMDPHTGEKLREIRIPEAGEIFNPTWGPEGRRVALSAQVNGYLDLMVVHLETGERRRITDDPFAEMHPSWSPDGSRIAFTTDRFGSDWSTLRPGQWRLATVDMETLAIEPVAAFESGKHINPQWSPDGGSLYFLADPDGVTNLYRRDMVEGRTYRLTNLSTGVSGITGLSPAVSVARGARKAVFSVPPDGTQSFDLYTMERPERLAGEPVEETGPLAGLSVASLPPEDRGEGRVDALLADARLGLADTVTFETRDYDSGLSLDYIGRPNLSLGADQFGFFLGGGGSLYFSDMLGNRNLATLVQVNSSSGQILNSTALFANYTNRSGRWNWGLIGGQLPFISRSVGGFDDVQNGRPVFVFQDLRFFQVNRQVDGVIEYPFNEFQRLEFSAGFRNVDFASEVREVVIDRSTGEVISEETRPFAPLDTVSSINQARASAALVYDNAIFGATAPMLGQRYRLEVTPTVGNVSYYSALADYRKYFMPVRPFTLAFRGLHFGRYGEDAEDFRLSQIYLGEPSLVRGYEAGAVVESCRVTGSVGSPLGQFGGSCTVLQNLLGSRIGVFNAEARLPFLGGIGLIPTGHVPPVDLLAFFDAGVAWTKAQEPKFLGGSRGLLRSVGVGARMNLFGLAIVELDYVNPLDRPEDWYWDLSLVPGF